MIKGINMYLTFFHLMEPDQTDLFNVPLMNFLWSSIIFGIIFIGKRLFLKESNINVFIIMSLYLCCVIRLLSFFILPYQVLVDFPVINPIIDLLCLKEFRFFNIRFYLFYVIGIIYFIIVISKLIKLVRAYGNISDKYSRVNDIRVCNIFDRVLHELNMNETISLVSINGISSPLSIGGRYRLVIMPNDKCGNYSDIDLENIFRHECMHIKNNDYYRILLVNIAECFFFWNPIIYLLRQELEQSIEIRCDACVTQNMDKEGRRSYLTTLNKLIRDSYDTNTDSKGNELVNSLGMVAAKDMYLQERFKKVARYSQKEDIKKELLLFGICILLFISSYVFYFQAAFQPTRDEIVEGKADTYVVDLDKDYVLQYSNGDCYVYLENETVVIKLTKEQFDGWVEMGGEVIEVKE